MNKDEKKITYYCDRCKAEVEDNSYLCTITITPHGESVNPMFFEYEEVDSNSIEVCTYCRNKVVGFLREGEEKYESV